MKTLVTYPPKIAIKHGFSLLEVLIVLVILSFIAGIVFPRMGTIYSRTIFHFEEQQITGSLATLGIAALKNGKPITLLGQYRGKQSGQADTTFSFSSDITKNLDYPNSIYLPENWQLRVLNKIEYKSNGLCKGGNLVLSFEGYSKSYTLKEPYCLPIADN